MPTINYHARKKYPNGTVINATRSASETTRPSRGEEIRFGTANPVVRCRVLTAVRYPTDDTVDAEIKLSSILGAGVVYDDPTTESAALTTLGFTVT